MNISDKLQAYKKTSDSLGLFQAIAFKLQKLRTSGSGRQEPFSIHSKRARYPLMCRPKSSDMEVFKQIFVDREYRCLDDVEVGSGLILDCGANVGYSSAYFLSRYPDATLVAVEPDPENFALLERNLAPFGSRVQTLCSAVWSHPADLVLSEAFTGDGQEWARQVRESRLGEVASMHAVDIGYLLHKSGKDRIAVLKVDIEGSEATVFSSNFEHWIGKVDNLVIELHGKECERVFHNAIGTLNFEVTRCDELTVCKHKAR